MTMSLWEKGIYNTSILKSSLVVMTKKNGTPPKEQQRKVIKRRIKSHTLWFNAAIPAYKFQHSEG
jgi:hypothetical protein